jgi:ABC-type branched-subunit amino acid transport system substrate-binding protein
VRCCLQRRPPLSRKPAARGAVKVGVLLPLTGNTAWAGKTNRIAAGIAAEEVNAQDLAGGYKIKPVFGDSQCKLRPAYDQAT